MTTASSPTLSALLFDIDALTAEVTARGGRAFHAKALRGDVLQRGVLDYDAMTSLPAALRERLAAELPLFGTRELRRNVAQDGATKLLLALADEAPGALRTVETVHIPPSRKSSTKGATLCVSTQVGCPVGCPFCASGKLGLERNLTRAEILEQFLRGRALGELSRAVVMGIGEPLLNFEELAAALQLVHDELGLGARKVTVSTVGFPDRLRRAAERRPPFQLAISLHTPFDAQRDELVPAMCGTPIDEVLAAGDAWFEATGREVTYEYVLLGGVNDTPEHQAELARRLVGRRATVNLIPYNPIARDGDYRRPAPERVEDFRAALEAAGLVATVRWSRGLESDAACGQLRLRS
ncbi:MAG: 23S rRNA (adenine(2503)-C(2))-methyltransferase RlmN [Planctomycetes bacterium]|nr:23S rRNA (adenine(2503)-C(2))-methyltransferase RlmN [Planctomycetota bacterium]